MNCIYNNGEEWYRDRLVENVKFVLGRIFVFRI